MKRMTGNGIATGLAYYERLRDIENILGDEYDLDLLQKQIQAYREGRCSGNCETLNCGDCGILDKIVDRLAAYEDTGLEPCDYSAMAHALKQAERAREDLTEMIRQIGATGLDRLRELAEADREGRCMVLPCKFGGPVWRLYDDCDFPGDCYTKQKCRGCEYRNLSIEKRVFCLSMLSQNGKLDPPYYTIRAEAEEALRREQDG